ncbi:tripartite tricarboxylate transporter substrate binding protein [Verticiella sediminum]|uniref:Tripartite tricarboxylate transporter substrate binding protein n=1 Tax=Verticiella sediminum TaxID=1247510 RepID=A0A556B0W2_9BURK|nr:tripartite tricarboxylate transporter substrate binding protein [Verticiella sediminum]TSH98821.1 tripartite tricarboxylate transporter substrate binding protein [Verticiella sediminum]
MQRRSLLRGLTAATLAITALSAPLPGHAADFPERPINLVVPFPPGGPTDALARRLADGLRQDLGQTVVVENRAGAGGNVGAAYVAKAKPDGYTLLFGTSGPLAINGSLYPDQGYDPRQDFAPVIRLGHLPNILVVRQNLPAADLQELIALAKREPLFFASSGNGASSHLAGILFNEKAGTELQHVPYRGTGPALTDLLGGQVDMSFTDVLTALPHVREGRLRAIGMASAQRSAALPDVPTLAEQGLDGYDVSVFFGIVAPAGTPEPIVQRLNTAFTHALAIPEVEQTLANQGIVKADDTSPAGLAAFIEAEVPKWGELIQREKIALD